jgi:4-carboxymuconolactone decarboxylase
MRLDRPRLDPLPLAEIDQETRELLGPGQPLNIFATLAHHPKLMKRWLVFGNHVLAKSTLPARERELVILRVGWLCRAEYEWGQHTAIGSASGLSDEEILRIAEGPQATGWGDFDRALLRATDELHSDSFISDDTWQTLSGHLTSEQLLDLIFAIGQYHLVSMALNTLGVQLDAGVEGFPKP